MRIFKPLIALLLATASAAGLSAAPAYPERPITLVVPFPAGGTTDLGARHVANQLSEILKQPVVVDNRAGAAGRIGTGAVARAKADGYTLLYGLTVTHGMLSASSVKLGYDPITSFTPIAPVLWFGAVLVCNLKVPANNIADLVAYAKSKPGGLTYSSAGIGSGSHFYFERFAGETGINRLHVPFRGGALSLQAVVSGEVDCLFDATARPFIKSGALRAFATTGLKRDPLYPDLPTLDESGLRGYDMTIWQGLLAPAGLPADVASTLRIAVQKMVRSPQFVASVQELGLNPLYGNGEDLSKMISRDVAKYKTLTKQFDISFE